MFACIFCRLSYTIHVIISCDFDIFGVCCPGFITMKQNLEREHVIGFNCHFSNLLWLK